MKKLVLTLFLLTSLNCLGQRGPFGYGYGIRFGCGNDLDLTFTGGMLLAGGGFTYLYVNKIVYVYHNFIIYSIDLELLDFIGFDRKIILSSLKETTNFLFGATPIVVYLILDVPGKRSSQSAKIQFIGLAPFGMYWATYPVVCPGLKPIQPFDPT